MKETLLAFVKATQFAAEDIRRHVVLKPSGLDYPHLWFGYGYFDRDKVLVWKDAGTQEIMTNEAAVDLFLASMQEPQ